MESNRMKNARILFDLGVVCIVLLIILHSTGCTTTSTGSAVNLPGAYQFCIEHPQEEECVE